MTDSNVRLFKLYPEDNPVRVPIWNDEIERQTNQKPFFMQAIPHKASTCMMPSKHHSLSVCIKQWLIIISHDNPDAM